MATTDADSEINSIMNEIEELQKEMAPQAAAPVAAAAAVAPPAASVQSAAAMSAEAPSVVDASAVAPLIDDDGVDDILNEIQAKISDAAGEPSLEDTLSDIKAEDSENSILDDEPAEEIKAVSEPVVHEEESMPKNEQGADGTLSLTLSGNMTVKLKYEFEGQEVTISFADQTLRVGMADGTEFKVPVGPRTAASNVKPFKKAV